MSCPDVYRVVTLQEITDAIWEAAVEEEDADEEEEE